MVHSVERCSVRQHTDTHYHCETLRLRLDVSSPTALRPHLRHAFFREITVAFAWNPQCPKLPNQPHV